MSGQVPPQEPADRSPALPASETASSNGEAAPSAAAGARAAAPPTAPAGAAEGPVPGTDEPPRDEPAEQVGAAAERRPAAPQADVAPPAAPAPNGNLGKAPAEARYGAGPGEPATSPPTMVPTPPAAPPPVLPPPTEPPPPSGGPPPTAGDDEPAEAGTMTILEHLEELRERIVKAGLAVIVGMVVSAIWLSGRVLEWLVALGTEVGGGLQNINPPAVFFEYMKVTVFAGVALALPIVLYQALMFVLPALTPKEKRYSFIIVPGSALCFAGGVAFGYYVLLPTTLRFLQGFAGQFVSTNWDISLFLGFVTTMLFWMGVAFQTPLVVFLVARLGLVSTGRLGQYRKYAFLAAFVIAAVITPTPDPLTQALVGIPIYLLYELGLLLARIVR